VIIGFGPGMLATNLLFQPVALDQLTTMVVLWLGLRLALGRGSWLLLGLAVGIGLETQYTLAVVLVLLIATFVVWRRDLLSAPGFPLAVAVAAILLVPNLVWQAGHGWTSVHWFLNPPRRRRRPAAPPQLCAGRALDRSDLQPGTASPSH
jgi:4-amino-4-deoxy-L-arabinose transferase-like glycosyltransferase